MYAIIRAITLERFPIITHSYAASFSMKTRFYETNNIFYHATKETS